MAYTTLTDSELHHITSANMSGDAAEIKRMLQNQISAYIDNTISFAFVMNNSSAYDYIQGSQANQISQYEQTNTNLKQTNLALLDKTNALDLQKLTFYTQAKATLAAAAAISLVQLLMLLLEPEIDWSINLVYGLVAAVILTAATVIMMMFFSLNSYVRRDPSKLYWAMPAAAKSGI